MVNATIRAECLQQFFQLLWNGEFQDQGILFWVFIVGLSATLLGERPLLIKCDGSVVRLADFKKGQVAAAAGRGGPPRGNTLFRATRYALDHPAFAGRTLTLDELREEPLIMMQAGAGVRAVIEEELRAAGLKLRDFDVHLELGLQESVKAAVMAGYGVTFISRSAVESELAAGTLAFARVEGLEPARQISLVRSTGRTPSRAADAFVSFARERLG